MFCARLFICALWSPAGKVLTSWLSFVVSTVSLSLSHWYPGSGVVLNCIDSWSLHPYLLYFLCNNSGLSILLHDVVLLPDAASCDKILDNIHKCNVALDASLWFMCAISWERWGLTYFLFIIKVPFHIFAHKAKNIFRYFLAISDLKDLKRRLYSCE